MTVEYLAGLAGVVLTVLFSYIPGLNTWFVKLSKEYQRLIMAGLLIVVAGGIYGLSCANILTTVSCNKTGLLELGKVLLIAVVANQGVYSITPKAPRVRAVKAAGK